MRKRFIAFTLLFSSMLSGVSYATNEEIEVTPDIPAVYAASTQGKKAYVSQMEIYLDGEQVKPIAYLISVDAYGAYTYFKLRDLAYLMNGKNCQFSVDYDEETRQIITKSGEKYVPNGSEMKASSSGDQIAYQTDSQILLDGKKVEMEAYSINGNTYYKLRDMGEVFGFDVSYKDSSRQAIIRTPSYTGPDTPETSEPDTPETSEPDTPETSEPDGNSPSDIITPTPEPEPEPTPNKVDGKLTVLIDVGHGGTDPGAGGTAPYAFFTYQNRKVNAGGGIYETDFNLPVALCLRDLLEASGANVIMSAETDKTVTFSERKKIIESNANTADMLISIHHNAFNGNASGFDILAQIKYKNGGDGYELAQSFEKEYIEAGRKRHAPTTFREGSNGDYYAILRYAANVDLLAIISEYAYIDNANDVECILSNEGVEREAQAMHDAILDFYSTHEY